MNNKNDKHTKSTAHERSDGADAFLPDPYGDKRGRVRAGDDSLAEALGEEFVLAATSGEEQTEDIRDELTTEELGGPFVVTRARDEFAVTDDDAQASEEGNREAFPTSSAIQR